MRTVTMRLFAPLLPLGIAALVACAGARSAPRLHPEKVEGPPRCSSCHEADQARFDHAIGFVRAHRDLAVQSRGTCDLCHQPAFCMDCHGNKGELKPSDINSLRPGSDAPHRGDYLTQHRIDGRINPAACFSCHGRKSDWRCRECHR